MPIEGPRLAAPADLSNLLTPGLVADPDGVAVSTVDEAWTWREVDHLTTRLAHAYQGMGLEPGDRIASLLPNRPRSR